jgi:hypothetical protein
VPLRLPPPAVLLELINAAPVDHHFADLDALLSRDLKQAVAKTLTGPARAARLAAQKRQSRRKRKTVEAFTIADASGIEPLPPGRNWLSVASPEFGRRQLPDAISPQAKKSRWPIHDRCGLFPSAMK